MHGASNPLWQRHIPRVWSSRVRAHQAGAAPPAPPDAGAPLHQPTGDLDPSIYSPLVHV